VRRVYGGSPYWLRAKYAGKCGKCSAEIKPGDSAFYYPSSRTIYGSRCGHAAEASADFEAHRFDEEAFA
jgi:hypothetical protein